MPNTTTGIDWQDCNLDTCSIDDSFYFYRPSLALNVALVVLFSISLLSNLVQGVWYRTWGYAFALVLGCIGEVLGYIGRILSYVNPFDMNAFLIQICCLTFAPAFLAAGIYLSLGRIVTIYGADISRIKPKRYTQIFIGCDFFSIVLQSAGGAVTSILSQDNKDPAAGTNIMMAGLAFQVFTLFMFIGLGAEFCWRVKSSHRQLDPIYAHLRDSSRFVSFLWALSLATILIQIRCIYRLIELAQGWDGALFRKFPPPYSFSCTSEGLG